jgi:hypothetical protein
MAERNYTCISETVYRDSFHVQEGRIAGKLTRVGRLLWRERKRIGRDVGNGMALFAVQDKFFFLPWSLR